MLEGGFYDRVKAEVFGSVCDRLIRIPNAGDDQVVKILIFLFYL